jgi:hypothetical protein
MNNISKNQFLIHYSSFDPISAGWKSNPIADYPGTGTIQHLQCFWTRYLYTGTFQNLQRGAMNLRNLVIVDDLHSWFEVNLRINHQRPPF